MLQINNQSIYIHPDNWEDASLEDIYEVILSVMYVMQPFFNTSDFISTSIEIFHSEREYPYCSKDRTKIFLAAQSTYWGQYAYQFSHEFCHCIIKYGVPTKLRWFEESICELASYFFLPLLTDLWLNSPPYPNWRGFNFTKNAIIEINKATPFNTNFNKEKNILYYLESNEYDRAKNAFIAQLLFPIFKEYPMMWSVIPSLSRLPSDISTMRGLQLLQGFCNNELQIPYQEILKIFSFEPLKNT